MSENNHYSPAVNRILERPIVAEGGRHQDINERILQLAGNRVPRQEIFNLITGIYPLGSGNDRKINEREIWNSIDGAIARDPKPTHGVNGNKALNYTRSASVQAEFKVEPYEHDGSTEKIPEGTDITISDFLTTVLGFNENEYVSFGAIYKGFWYGKEGKMEFEQWKTLTEVSKTRDFKSSSFSEYGSFYRINPFKPGSEHATKQNVSRFLYTLLEFDSKPKEEQIAIFKRSGVPIRALVDTGGKSIHAIIKIDAPDLKEYERRVKLVRDYVGQGTDQSTKDPNRFSRVPGSEYNKEGRVGVSRLLYTDIGAPSWDDWEANVENDDDLPEISTFDENEDDTEYEAIISQVLREQSKMTLASGSKGKKTWLLIQTGVCVATGIDWLGFKCNQNKVLYLNFELKRKTFNFRRNQIMKDLKITGKPQLDAIHFREYPKAFTVEHIVEGLKRKIKNNGYKLIIVDPQYKSLGNYRENEPQDMNKWWSALNPLLSECGASVIVAGHFTKGDSSNKAGIDRMSGSGVNAREPDVVASYDSKQNGNELPDGQYLMEFSGMREDPDIKSFYMQWAFPTFSRIAGSVRDTIKKDKLSNYSDAMDCLFKHCELTPGGWLDVYNNQFRQSDKPMADKTFAAWRYEMKKMGWIVNSGENNNSLTVKVASNARKHPKTGVWELSTVTVEGENKE